jgi:AraC-like DNA-binding protein
MSPALTHLRGRHWPAPETVAINQPMESMSDACAPNPSFCHDPDMKNTPAGFPDVVQLADPQTDDLDFQSLTSRHFNVGRLRSNVRRFGRLPSPPVDDGFLMAVKLRTFAGYQLRLGGRNTGGATVAKGGMCLFRSDVEIGVTVQNPFDIFRFQFQRTALRDCLEGYSRATDLRFPAAGMVDPVINHLIAGLLPSLGSPQSASQLFTTSVSVAIGAHLARLYGNTNDTGKAVRSGLAKWQESRAKEVLVHDLYGQKSIGEVAAEVGLSSAYFATAFKRSTGSSPTAWQIQQRIAKAKDLLALTDKPLVEIARDSGFSDQSHFTRHFSRAVGISPGRWRRNAGFGVLE